MKSPSAEKKLQRIFLWFFNFIFFFFPTLSHGKLSFGFLLNSAFGALFRLPEAVATARTALRVPVVTGELWLYCCSSSWASLSYAESQKDVSGFWESLFWGGTELLADTVLSITLPLCPPSCCQVSIWRNCYWNGKLHETTVPMQIERNPSPNTMYT